MTIAAARDMTIPGPANYLSEVGTSRLLPKNTKIELNIRSPTHKYALESWSLKQRFRLNYLASALSLLA